MLTLLFTIFSFAAVNAHTVHCRTCRGSAGRDFSGNRNSALHMVTVAPPTPSQASTGCVLQPKNQPYLVRDLFLRAIRKSMERRCGCGGFFCIHTLVMPSGSSVEDAGLDVVTVMWMHVPVVMDRLCSPAGARLWRDIVLVCVSLFCPRCV